MLLNFGVLIKEVIAVVSQENTPLEMYLCVYFLMCRKCNPDTVVLYSTRSTVRGRKCGHGEWTDILRTASLLIFAFLFLCIKDTITFLCDVSRTPGEGNGLCDLKNWKVVTFVQERVRK